MPETIYYPISIYSLNKGNPTTNFHLITGKLHFQKFISSPMCRSRECSWRGMGKMPDQHKTPLKLGQSGWNFDRKLSLYQRMDLYRAGQLEGYFRNFNFRGGKCQVYHNIANMTPNFNFMHILIINVDILGAFGALHVWPEIISPKYCCKNRQK